MTVATVTVGCDGEHGGHGARDKPRIISEVRKNQYTRTYPLFASMDSNARPKISGELLWRANPTQWHVKLGEVRQGSLVVHCTSTGNPEFRLPLHHLNITAAHTPRTFTLATSQGIPLATFQSLTEEEYQRWVRVLAVEVLRQTPLHDIRSLDILGITRGCGTVLRRGQSEECLPTLCQKPHDNSCKNLNKLKEKTRRTEFSQWLHCVKRETDEENRTKNGDFDMKNMKIRRAQRVRPKLPFADSWSKFRERSESNNNGLITQLRTTSILEKKSISMDNLSMTQIESVARTCGCDSVTARVVSDESGISSGDENNNSNSDVSLRSEKQTKEDIYVSVREKKIFFESLSTEGDVKRPDVSVNRSSSIGHYDSRVGSQPAVLKRQQRATSMQDLSKNAVPVKQIRRLFESSNPLSQSMDELRMSNDAKTTIVEEEEDARSDDNPVKDDSAPSFVNPIRRKPKETVNYANIHFCRKSTSRENTDERDEQDDSNTFKLPSNGVDGVNEITLDESIRGPPLTDDQSSNVRNLSNVTHTPGSEPPPLTNHTSSLLIQRKLQRGERKLQKLRLQIAEVEETIKIIAEDLQSIGPKTLKRRAGLEVFAALRRRLEEETSRLERLQEETTKVISDNQRTILKRSTNTSDIAGNYCNVKYNFY